jgi:hypothetical protein
VNPENNRRFMPYADTSILNRFEDIVINCRVNFYNVKFESEVGWTFFTNIIFQKSLSISNSELGKIVFHGVKFKNGIHLSNVEAKTLGFEHSISNGFVNFDQCNVENIFSQSSSFSAPIIFDVSELIVADMLKSEFVSLRFIASNISKRLNIDNCRFNSADNEGIMPQLQIFACSNSMDTMFGINSTTFEGKDSLDVIDLNTSTFGFTQFINNKFEPLLRLKNLNIKQSFWAEGNEFGSKIDCLNFNFPKDAFFLPWENIAGKIVISPVADMSPQIRSLTFYDGSSREEIADGINFNKFISAYASFYFAYKSNLNMSDANKCYVEMKDFETLRYEHLYKASPSLKTFFDWQINSFLKIFSNYGTDSVKAIIFAMYVVLIFAFIYFFFPNSWDTMNRNKLMKRIKMLIKYLRSKEGIVDVYEEERKPHFQSYEDFKNYLDQSRKEIPFYFHLLAKPLYYFSISNYKLTQNILHKTELLDGKWIELPKKRRRTTSIVVGLWLAGYILLDLILKFFNALILSINTFTTLGFGEIPLKGIPRYLAVIQGFIGWFMLTLFSVSLIRQVLN